MKRKTLKLSKIRLDGNTQPRAGINTTLVAEYATAMEEGNADFPPAVVFFDGTDYWLADGFHRWHAANKNDVAGIYCEIHDGTVEDARWYSYAANQTHGQRRSNADKEKAVKAALLHPNGAGLSDTRIAEHVGVAVHTVSKYRAGLVSTMQIAESPTRQGRDGRTIDTTNIGGGGAEEDEKEEEEEEEEDVEEELEEEEEAEPESAETAEWKNLRAKVVAYADKQGRIVVAAMLENLATELRH